MSKLPCLDTCVCGHGPHDHRDPNRWPQTGCQRCECDRFEPAEDVNADLAVGTVVDLVGHQVRLTDAGGGRRRWRLRKA